MSRAFNISLMSTMMRCGRTKERSPGTASFKVGMMLFLQRRSSVVRRPLWKSPKVWTRIFPSHSMLDSWAICLPYSIGVLKGFVKFLETRIAKFVLFVLYSFDL